VEIMPMFSPAGMSLSLNNLPGLGSTLQVRSATPGTEAKEMLEASGVRYGSAGSAASTALGLGVRCSAAQGY
jgi:hypothetical protein